MSSSFVSRVESVHPSYLHIHHKVSTKVQKVVNVFLDLLSSCAGPSGKIHVVRNNCGGHVIFTSTSTRLLESVFVTCPELKLVVAAVQSHLNQNSDCGLFMGCVCLQMIQLSVRSGIHFHIHRSLFDIFLHTIVDYVRSPDCKISVKADFTDIQVLLAYVRSVVTSKRLLNETRFESMKLSELIMKAFVESIPAHHSNMKIINSNGVYILDVVKSHIRESRIEHGLLLEYPELSAIGGLIDITSKLRLEVRDEFSTSSHVKVALFTCSMSGDMEEIMDVTFEATKLQFEHVENSVLDKMLNLCDCLEKCQVGLVLCQKVIHPKLKVVLRLKGILFIDRLGLQKIPYLQDLTGAHPIVSVLSTSNIIDHLGWIDSVSHVLVNDKSYLHLTRTSASVVTFILCAEWEEKLAELKNCVKTSLHGLYTLSKDQRLLAGGGCWQTHCSYVLKNKICMQLPDLAEQVGCTQAQILSSLAVFRSSLHHWVRSLSDSSEDVLVDLSSFHCWRVLKGRELQVTESEISSCCCGLKSVSTNILQDFDVISEHEHTSAFNSPNIDIKKTPVIDNMDFSNIILDNISPALQALERGVCAANVVLSIAVSISDKN
uniref:McKusick-Kaufman/Bardet-Biedl syndromes chaperonin n=1 Tax=Arion vulgaris TaxID=1028688 RepID=A0A0B7AQ43_9EUPU